MTNKKIPTSPLTRASISEERQATVKDDRRSKVFWASAEGFFDPLISRVDDSFRGHIDKQHSG
jgi:hypothetical protein